MVTAKNTRSGLIAIEGATSPFLQDFAASI
jgi:hypothetical protein